MKKLNSARTHGVFGALIALSLAVTLQTAFAAEPTVHEIYTQAEAGHMREARQMMEQVLRNHPNSGKAHFVNAELLAREGQIGGARAELAAAERLSPGLSFESPASVQKLRTQLAAPSSFVVTPTATPGISSPGIPWGLLLLALVVIFGIVMLVRSFTRRAISPTMTMPNPTQPTYGSPPYGAPPTMGGGMMGGGMGSGIMGGLATGAAIGAGMVAGEALAHRLTDDPNPHQRITPEPNPQSNWDDNNDLGGQDFGVTDNSSSWDSGGGDMGGGGGDWG